MKKLFINSTLLVCLVVAALSLWYVAQPPIVAHAASSSAKCLDGEVLSCTATNSVCIGLDATPSMTGYCRCISLADGSETRFNFCLEIGPPPEPPLAQ